MYCSKPTEQIQNESSAYRQIGGNEELVYSTHDFFRHFVHNYAFALDSPAAGPRNEEIESAIKNRGKKGSHTFWRTADWKYILRPLQGWQYNSAINSHRKLYYTSSAYRGEILPMDDVDCHRIWQTAAHASHAKAIINDLFPRYFVESDRGANGYLRVSTNGANPAEINRVTARYQNAMRLLLAHHKCWADYETKGTLSYFENGKFHRGSFGKLPIHKQWDVVELAQFAEAEGLSLTDLDAMSAKIESQIRPEVLIEWNKAKAERDKPFQVDRLDAASVEPFLEHALERGGRKYIPINSKLWNGRPYPHSALTVEEANARTGVNGRECVPLSVVLRTKPLSPPASGSSRTATAVIDSATPRLNNSDRSSKLTSAASHILPSSRRVNSVKGWEPEDSDAFARDQGWIYPFARAFFRRNGRLPKTEEALDHKQRNILFSGDWHDNERHRERRVRAILGYLGRTFDPSKSNDSIANDELKINSGLNRQLKKRFPDGLDGVIYDKTEFESETMNYPIRKRVHVPLRFIQHCTQLASFFFANPNSGDDLPVKRFIWWWDKLPDAPAWNQDYFMVWRDQFEELGFLNIFDKNHFPGQSWKWKPGKNWLDYQVVVKEAESKEPVVEQSIPQACRDQATRIEERRNNNRHNLCMATIPENQDFTVQTDDFSAMLSARPP